MSDEPLRIHVDAAHKRPELPDVGEALRCGRADCPDEFTFGYGLAGGGCGIYEYCEVCGRVVSKTEEYEEERAP